MGIARVNKRGSKIIDVLLFCNNKHSCRLVLPLRKNCHTKIVEPRILF
ncbi:Uncharacterised protein [Vibrio cholerae]|nr:Uncharacterised protein [Vibrio cholerae]